MTWSRKIQSDDGLRDFAVPFAAELGANYAAYFVAETAANNNESLTNAYVAALDVARNTTTRTRVTVTAKNTAADALRADLRFLIKTVEANPAVSKELLSALGLSERKTPTRIDRPTTWPGIDVTSVAGRIVRARLHGTNAAHRGRPEGVAGAALFTYTGDAPSPDPADYEFHGNTTLTDVLIDFGPGPAQTVYVTAMWYNPRGESGPGCQPVQINLPASTAVSPKMQVAKAA